MQIHTTSYATEVFNFIFGGEGLRDFPYFDSAKPTPKATIGYGFNLEVPGYLRIVLQTMGLFDGKTNAEIAAIQQTFTNKINSTPEGDSAALRTNLNTAAKQYGLPSFTMTDPQAKATFNAILSGATIGGME